MKKILIIAAILLNCSALIAAPALKVKSGKWAQVKSESALTYVEFDYSKAMWEEDKTYESFCGDTYGARVTASITDFVDSYNLGTSGLKMTIDQEAAKYKLVFHIDNLERKQGMTMWGRFFIRVYGTIEVVDLATDTPICEIIVKGHAGGDDFVPEDRLSKCFKSLAEKLLKLK